MISWLTSTDYIWMGKISSFCQTCKLVIIHSKPTYHIWWPKFYFVKNLSWNCNQQDFIIITFISISLSVSYQIDLVFELYSHLQVQYHIIYFSRCYYSPYQLHASPFSSEMIRKMLHIYFLVKLSNAWTLEMLFQMYLVSVHNVNTCNDTL